MRYGDLNWQTFIGAGYELQPVSILMGSAFLRCRSSWMRTATPIAERIMSSQNVSDTAWSANDLGQKDRGSVRRRLIIDHLPPNALTDGDGSWRQTSRRDEMGTRCGVDNKRQIRDCPRNCER